MERRIRLFRTSIFGGYKKSDVARYVQRLELEVEELEEELEALKEETGGETSRKKEKDETTMPQYDASVIEESIAEIKLLRKENERLESELERLGGMVSEKTYIKESAAAKEADGSGKAAESPG